MRWGLLPRAGWRARMGLSSQRGLHGANAVVAVVRGRRTAMVCIEHSACVERHMHSSAAAAAGKGYLTVLVLHVTCNPS